MIVKLSKEKENQIMREFGLVVFERIPFSLRNGYDPVSLDDLKNVYSGIGGSAKINEIWASEFENLSGTKYVCGISDLHVRHITASCSCTGDYGLLIQTDVSKTGNSESSLSYRHSANPLSQGHIINLNFNKNHLRKNYSNIEEFIKENPSPVRQSEFLNHKMISGEYHFTADIVYRAVFEIVSPLFEEFIELEKKFRNINEHAPIKIRNNLVAQDTYVKLIF